MSGLLLTTETTRKDKKDMERGKITVISRNDADEKVYFYVYPVIYQSKNLWKIYYWIKYID